MKNYDNITIEKGMYQCRGGLTGALEGLDPSENYVGSALEGLDAFSRQLKRFDIKVSGKNSDCIEKFFQTSNSAALFPEYVSRAVLQGIQRASILPDIVATVTDIDGLDYRSITSEPDRDELKLAYVSEGAQIPETNIRTSEKLVKLRKRGRILTASYETIRFQRLDLFTVTLNQIGAYIARAQAADAVNALIGGDGNNNPCAVISTSESGKLKYSDLVSLWSQLYPYELNTMLASPETMQQVLNMEQMQQPATGLDFQGTGKMVTPLGAKLLCAPETGSSLVVGFDKNCALEMVQAGGVLTEYDKLIDRQLERTAITCVAGFSKIYPGAAVALSSAGA